MADQVSLTIEEDTGAPPGHARLCFAGLTPPADPRFRLRRLDAEPEHLGTQGWQNSPALLTPDRVVDENGTTVLQVGPAVVDRIAADAPIALELPAAGLSLRSYWPDIAPSPGAADPSVALAAPAGGAALTGRADPDRASATAEATAAASRDPSRRRHRGRPSRSASIRRRLRRRRRPGPSLEAAAGCRSRSACWRCC